ADRVGGETGTPLRGDGRAAASIYRRTVVGLAPHLESRDLRAGGAGVHRPVGPDERVPHVRAGDPACLPPHGEAHGSAGVTRVLMLGWEYPPHITGGLAVATAGVVRGLLAQDVAVDLLIPVSADVEPRP